MIWFIVIVMIVTVAFLIKNIIDCFLENKKLDREFLESLKEADLEHLDARGATPLPYKGKSRNGGRRIDIVLKPNTRELEIQDLKHRAMYQPCKIKNYFADMRDYYEQL